MKNFITGAVVTAGMLLASSGAFAGAFGEDGMVGKHYQVNFIGVPHDKSVDMTNSNRRTIFVPLNADGEVGKSVKIKYMVDSQDNSFRVIDGDATDGEAIIQVPYEYCTDYTTGCTDLLGYDVYAIALGKPYGGVLVTAECDYTKQVVDPGGTTGLECEDTLLMGSFDIQRKPGRPTVKDITNIFRAEGCLDNNADNICNTGDLEFRNMWIFNIEELASYMWDYDNNGLKLLQVRFYESSSEYIGYVK